MPLTFIDIERQKNWRIAVFFLVLLLLYLAVVLVVTAPLTDVAGSVTPRYWVAAVLASLLAAGLHFWFSGGNAVASVTRTLNAQPPDPSDDIHRMFLNIVEEIHVVTGGKRTIRCAVIPSLSLNALAAADLRGNALIAVTEGLLSRLTRPQAEAVVAHEAHHVLSGDCLETTVAASIFGTLSAALEKFRTLSSNRILFVPAVAIAWILLKLSSLLNLFISREREYRADAAAVRMTRNPIALAEVFHLLSRSWRGAGFIGGGLEMLCIVNPQTTQLDEREGFVADLLSTHPPLRKRMDIMLQMARVSVTELDARASGTADRQGSNSGPRYHAMNPKQSWQGPFTLQELAGLPWLTPLTWVTTDIARAADRAWRDPLINAIIQARLAAPECETSGIPCPSCNQPLRESSRDGTQVSQCRFCAGTLIETAKIHRIIARTGRANPCTERVNALARTALKENQLRQVHRALERSARSTVPALSCPKCGNPMYRGFYSMTHLVEVDRCSYCGLTWFDQDELAMLQCLIENRLVQDQNAMPAVSSQQ
jgi:heat shock protein HtpX